MDPLSHILALLGPEAVGWRMIEGRGAWTLRARPDPNVVVFGQSLKGGCEIVRDDGRSFHTACGDFMLMASPPPWEMRALGGGAPVDLKAQMADTTLLFSSDEAAPVTRFMGGYFKFAVADVELLSRLMLPIVHLRADEVRAGRLGTLLALLSDEATAERPGGPQVLRRLLEILLVEVLRRPGCGWDQAGRGLLAGLAHPRIGPALRLMHDDVGRGWTVGDLAREVAMSRSVFAARFTDVVGSPPIEYLANWRMMLAKQALLDETATMSDVAELAGYRSVSAFSTAFSRRTGEAPSRYARSSARAAAS